MLLFWRIRYLDTRDKQFKDRDLWLDTDSLDPVTKAAVELCNEQKELGCGRDMLQFRHLFSEKSIDSQLDAVWSRARSMSTVSSYGYFEDENGNELTNKQMAVVLSGNPGAMMFPSSARQHDIALFYAEKRPIPIDQISLSQEQLNVLVYFTRDLGEMLDSAFFGEGAGTLKSSGGGAMVLSTAVTDEEIRSFVTIFRRLYMDKEPANLRKAASVVELVLTEYAFGRWIKGEAAEYEATLAGTPSFVPLPAGNKFPFSRKRLIDVYLYTQYAHQPSKDRLRQFGECLAAVDGRRALLDWLFLTAMWECCLHMGNAGRWIADFCDRYCECHQVSPDVLVSIADHNPGLGGLETKEACRERIFTEKAEELAKSIWREKSCPDGGPNQFIDQARQRLREATDGSGRVARKDAACP